MEEQTNNQNKIFNIYLLGDIKTEKKKIFQEILQNEQSEITQPFEIQGESINMKILDDTPLENIFSDDNTTSQGILLFYNVTDAESYNQMKEIVSKILEMNKNDRSFDINIIYNTETKIFYVININEDNEDDDEIKGYIKEEVPEELKKKIDILLKYYQLRLKQTNKEEKSSIKEQNSFSQSSKKSGQNSLSNENSIIRKKMGLSSKIKDKYNDTIKYKLLSAQKEIDNLTIMNANKDNIIMIMQKFINNINNIICNGKINLNLENIDIKTFIKNLNQLEQKIISKLFKKKKSQSNKIPEDIIKDAKQNSIMKQKTEISFAKNKNLYIIPLISMKHNSKINSQISINKTSKYSNNSLNSICQYSSNNKYNYWKEMRCLTGKNKDKSTKPLCF